MPQQIVRPAAWCSETILVLSPQEIRLLHDVVQRQLARRHAPLNLTVPAAVTLAVADHADEATTGLRFQGSEPLRFGQAHAHRDFDEYVLTHRQA